MAEQRNTIKLHYERSTKGTHVFSCHPSVQQTASIPSLYIRKSAFADRNPPAEVNVEYMFDDANTVTPQQ